MNILKEICSKKSDEIKSLKKKINFDKNESIHCRGFLNYLVKESNENFNIIAEIKRSSPSKGIIRENFDVLKIAKSYESAGAKCISILTEKNYFGGDITYIKKVKKVSSLPILRKDFIIDEWQIYESFYSGADCILLILAILNDRNFLKFYKIAKDLGLDVICEVHDQDELSRVLKIDVECIGINNRNLKTLEINPETFNLLSKSIPKDIIKICESGINDSLQLNYYSKNGADAFLIGESLMKSPDILEETRKLIKK
tara:strand:- start:202 stop:972 length:771 start_codon:yes stop_codon:yes gene_type:complete